MKIPAFGYEFVFPYSEAGGQVMPTERWYSKRYRADMVRVLRKYDLKVITVDTVASGKIAGGYLIKNAIA